VDSLKRAGYYAGLVKIINKRSLCYFGQTVRTTEKRYPNMLLHGQIEGAGPKVRLKKKWLDNIQEDSLWMD